MVSGCVICICVVYMGVECVLWLWDVISGVCGQAVGCV